MGEIPFVPDLIPRQTRVLRVSRQGGVDIYIHFFWVKANNSLNVNQSNKIFKSVCIIFSEVRNVVMEKNLHYACTKLGHVLSHYSTFSEPLYSFFTF